MIILDTSRSVASRYYNNNLNNRLHLDPITHTATWCDDIISSPSGRIIISLDAAGVWRKIRAFIN